MPDLTVASTTDDQAAVNAAAGGVAQDEELAELKPPPTGDPQVESDAEAALEPEPQPKEQPKVPRGVDKRIDKLTREKNELAAKVAALEARQTPEPAPEPAKAPQIPVEVAAKFDTFDSWSQKQLEAGQPASIDDFLEARDAWKDARNAQQAEKEAQAEYQAEIAGAYNEKVEAFKSEHDDWEEVVGGSNLTLPPGVGPAILELENGPDVTYYLATHPKDVQRLGELSPFLAVAEVGRIAARLEKTAPEPAGAERGPDRQPTVSKAPAPIKPLGGHALRATADLNDPDLSYEDYRKIRDQQEKARFRR